jgi:lipoprotein-anchoring transpeptidase ErfK/SrfK
MGLGPRRLGAAFLICGFALVCVAVGLFASGAFSGAPSASASHSHPRAHHVAAQAAPDPTTTTTTAPPAPAPAAPPPLPIPPQPASTLVAATHGAIPGYAGPGAAPDRTVPGSWFGYPSVLPVIATQPGWLEVRLAQRPNGSTTWVQQSDVTLSTTPYAIVVDLGTNHLVVFQNGSPILSFAAGVGAPDDPTPTGNYFMTMIYPPPGPGYGPFVLVTSDHSDSISDWENSGDAIIGIHGPITSYDDSLIGSTGARISHGCIRLHDADLAQLRMIPAGTTIEVIA